METIEIIKSSPVYKQIMADSYGGIIYNVDNYKKYDTKEIMDLWNNLTNSERSFAGGIMNGAFDFLMGDED